VTDFQPGDFVRRSGRRSESPIREVAAVNGNRLILLTPRTTMTVSANRYELVRRPPSQES